MSLINREQARRIVEWEKKYPEKAKRLQEEHKKLYELLRKKKLSLEEFIVRHEALREELHKGE